MPVAQADSRSVWRSRREVSDGQGKKEREMDVMQAGDAQQPHAMRMEAAEIEREESSQCP